MALGLTPKLFFKPVVTFLFSLYPSREVETRQATISALADPRQSRPPKLT
jgi:hypothetical protein